MKVLKPTVFQAAMLLATNAIETVALWNVGTTYALDAQARAGGRIYQSLVAGNLGNAPAASATKWVDLGPDNTNAAFDGQVSTAATGVGSLTYTLATGILDAVALVNVSAATVSITVRDGPGGAVLYTATVGMDGSTVLDWYQYFFYDPLLARTQVVFDGIPPFGSAVVELTLTGGSVSLGHIAFGRVVEIGDAQFGATAGITDYSKKETDEFGVTTFVRRDFSKRLTARVEIPNLQLNRVQRLLYDLRATPCVWIAADDPLLDEPMTVFGYYRDFQTEIAYPKKSLCSIEIEGLA